MIIAIDFDGTIAGDGTEYPEIGEMKPNAKSVINRLYDEGHEILINTCRVGEAEAMVYRWLKEKGIKYHYINRWYN